MTKGRPPWPHREVPKGQLDTEATAELIGMAPSTLRGYRRRGVGPKSFKDPWGKVRYLLVDVQAWMAEEGASRW